MPEKANPGCCHVVASDNTQAPQHQSSMMVLITGQTPPCGQPRCKQQAAPRTRLLSGLPSSSASPPRTGYEVSAAGLTSSSHSRSTSCHQHLCTSRFETNFQSLAKLVPRLFLPRSQPQRVLTPPVAYVVCPGRVR